MTVDGAAAGDAVHTSDATNRYRVCSSSNRIDADCLN
jgi:hypothetical protein